MEIKDGKQNYLIYLNRKMLAYWFSAEKLGDQMFENDGFPHSCSYSNAFDEFRLLSILLLFCHNNE
jgi:hypothetical protein